MTVAELIAALQRFDSGTPVKVSGTPVKVFFPFDSNGPETWEEPYITSDGGEVRIEPKENLALRVCIFGARNV